MTLPRAVVLALTATLAACTVERVPFPDRSGAASPEGGENTEPTEEESTASPAAPSAPGAPAAAKPSEAAPAPGGSLAAGARTLTKTVAGLARTVRLHVPASITQRKLPVVLALHGNGDQATNFIATSGLLTLADSVGFVLVAPQGAARAISVGGQTTPPLSWDAYNARAQNADVQLFDALLDEIVGSGSVDAKRIVVYGYSQGGYASVRYGREAGARLACAAVIAAADAGGVPTAFPRKLPFSIQIGSADGARSNAASLAQSLQIAGHPVDFHEIAGAGHSPLPRPARAPLDDCLARALP
jgi:poly(3-hydroxybutyrate) depolymerase